MKINEKTRKEIEKLVDKFIKSHAEKDEEGKLTGYNPILKISTPNLVKFLKSEEFFQIGKIPIPATMRRPSERRDFHKNLNLLAKHDFKEKMDRKAYNEEFERDPTIMVENYKEYVKLKEEEEWY